jgi:hypothetical protein
MGGWGTVLKGFPTGNKFRGNHCTIIRRPKSGQPSGSDRALCGRIVAPTHCSSCVQSPSFNRDEHQNGRPLAYQDVAFEDRSPLPSLQGNPQVQSEGSFCGGGDFGRTYQRRFSCELGLIKHDGRREAAELRSVPRQGTPPSRRPNRKPRRGDQRGFWLGVWGLWSSLPSFLSRLSLH